MILFLRGSFTMVLVSIFPKLIGTISIHPRWEKILSLLLRVGIVENCKLPEIKYFLNYPTIFLSGNVWWHMGTRKRVYFIFYFLPLQRKIMQKNYFRSKFLTIFIYIYLHNFTYSFNITYFLHFFNIIFT